MTLYLIIFLTLFILAWVGFPLIQTGHTRRLDYELLLERHRSIMNALGDLYDKNAAGEIEGDDFNNIETGLLKKLAKVERVLGENPDQAQCCSRCGASLKNHFQFCVACGAAVAHEKATPVGDTATSANKTADSLS